MNVLREPSVNLQDPSVSSHCIYGKQNMSEGNYRISAKAVYITRLKTIYALPFIKCQEWDFKILLYSESSIPRVSYLDS